MDPWDVTYFPTPADFRAWLAEHHDARDELWVGYWKKATGHPSMTWKESVDVALCFGWIDGLRKRIDEAAYAIRFTPRRDGSTWSLRNVERYGAMEAEGRVHPAGRAAFERRVEDKTGTYSFEQKEPRVLSEDFEARLRANEDAWAAWEAKPPGYRKRVTHWVMSAKKEETRERRLGTLIEELAAGTA